MNHSESMFGSAAAQLQRRVGHVPQLDAVLAVPPRSSRYAAELEAAAVRLQAEQAWTPDAFTVDVVAEAAANDLIRYPEISVPESLSLLDG